MRAFDKLQCSSNSQKMEKCFFCCAVEVSQPRGVGVLQRWAQFCAPPSPGLEAPDPDEGSGHSIRRTRSARFCSSLQWNPVAVYRCHPAPPGKCRDYLPSSLLAWCSWSFLDTFICTVNTQIVILRVLELSELKKA